MGASAARSQCAGMRVSSIPGAVCLRRGMFLMSSKVPEIEKDQLNAI
jgi:hypothetical protein